VLRSDDTEAGWPEVTSVDQPEAGLPDTHQSAKWVAGALRLDPFTFKTLLKRAGPRMGAPSASPCLSGAWVSGTLLVGPRNERGAPSGSQAKGRTVMIGPVVCEANCVATVRTREQSE
jgi:hypothetical protein